MVIVSLVINLVTKPWTIEPMQKEVLEIPTTLLDVGDVTALAILLHIAILWDATVVVGLVIRPKNVVSQEDNKWEMPHTTQQGNSINLGKEMILKGWNPKGQVLKIEDILKFGWKRLDSWILVIIAKEMAAIWPTHSKVPQRPWNTLGSWSLWEELKSVNEQLMIGSRS